MPPVPRHRARKGTPKPDRRRALELLATSPDGATEAIMLAHGFTTGERVRAGRHTMEVARVRITEAGRQILGGD